MILHLSLRASSFAACFQEVCTTTFACYRWDTGQYIRLTMAAKVDDTYWRCWQSLWMHVRFQDLTRWLSSSFPQPCHCGSWSDCVPTIWRVLAWARTSRSQWRISEDVRNHVHLEDSLRLVGLPFPSPEWFQCWDLDTTVRRAPEYLWLWYLQ